MAGWIYARPVDYVGISWHLRSQPSEHLLLASPHLRRSRAAAPTNQSAVSGLRLAQGQCVAI